MKLMFRLIVLLFAAVMCVSSQIDAYELVWQPSGLNPGDQYQLAFVTDDRYSATSYIITDYDALVQAEANAADIGTGSTLFGQSIIWSVIGSTTLVDAREHALVQAPVYNLAGMLVAHDYNDMWDGQLVSGQHGFRFTPGGDYLGYREVWTGTGADGTRFFNHGLGYNSVTWGSTSYFDERWIQYLNQQAVISPLGQVQMGLYALSEVITVPEPVPVPATLLLFGSGCAGLIGMMRRKKKQN